MEYKKNDDTQLQDKEEEYAYIVKLGKQKLSEGNLRFRL
jgi:hypothetical protein